MHVKKSKNGDFILKVELDADRGHEFRFLIDEDRWGKMLIMLIGMFGHTLGIVLTQ